MTEIPQRISLRDNSLIRNGIDEAIRFFDQPVSLGGYTIEPFDFVREESQKGNGCKYIIKPGASSHVAEVKNCCSMIEAPVKGSGWFLYIDPEGKVTKNRFDNVTENNPSISFELPVSSVSVWIADPQGFFEVVNISDPPYAFGMNRFYSENDSCLPDEFWQEYWDLITTVDTADRKKYLRLTELAYESDGTLESYLAYLACESDAKPMAFSDLAKKLDISWDRKSRSSQKELLKRCYDIFTKGKIGFYPGDITERILVTAVQVINLLDQPQLKFKS